MAVRLARPHRAFTLLEVLLAITVLATLMALIAASWRVAGDWTSVAAHQRRALQLPRVADIVRSQWAERRTSLDLEKPGQTVFIGPGRVEFITSLAVLDRSLPLVIASYAVEADDSASAPAGTYRLVYSERAIIDMRAPQRASDREEEPGATTASAATTAPGLEVPPARTTVFLGACTELVLEYFDDGEDARRAAREREEDRRRAAEEDALRRGESADAARERAESVAGAEQIEEPEAAWKALERSPETPPPAVRIRGVHQGEAFSCLMVVAPSR